jgi:hypothetical protein
LVSGLHRNHINPYINRKQHLFEIIVCINTVSLHLASFIGAGHFLLNAFLEGLVKILACSLQLMKISLASWLKVLRPCLDHLHGKLLMPQWSANGLSLLVALVNLVGDWH